MISKFVKIIVVFLAVAASLTANAATRKYHPGHYVELYKSDGHTQMISAIKPGVVGMLRNYRWSELETSKGVYDFSKPQADLTFLAGQGMRLIVLIGDKTFDGTYPTPPYLQSAPYTLKNRAGGYTAARWNSTVVARYKALMAAFGKKFDGQAYFEGVATPETALGLDSSVLDANGYTPERYRDAMINYLSSASQSMPTSRVFWHMNYLVRGQSYLEDIAIALAPYGVVVGAPDVMPDNSGLKRTVYPLYDKLNGKVKLFSGIETACYKHPHADTTYPTKYWTPKELRSFAHNKLYVNYLIWTRVAKANPVDSYDFADAVPVIGANPVTHY